MIFEILKDNIPVSYSGRHFGIIFGYSVSFGSFSDKIGIVYCQIEMFAHIIDPSTSHVQFEYRLLYAMECDKTIADEGFYEYIYSFMLSAISHFDRNLKLHNSSIVNTKSYFPIPSLEQTIDNVRAQYGAMKFNTVRESW